MPGKFTDGYTKKSQQQKFIRHRDVKMKDSELKKEQKTQKLMCEGICRRCREKVQWRFKYDKYKPLKAIATCQQCKQKKVTKAYRTLCDGCASTKGVCPSCCLDPEQTAQLDEEDQQKEASGEKKESSSSSSSSMMVDNEESLSTVPPTVFSFSAGANQPVAAEGDEMMEEGDETQEDDEEEQEEEEEEELEVGDNDVAEEEQTDLPDDTELLGSNGAIDNTVRWNEKKFHNIAASKYSKQRKVAEDV
jgi:hypothetical protein